MVDPSIQKLIPTLAPYVGVIIVIGAIMMIIERKIDDYNWLKRKERRKKLWDKYHGNKK